MMSKTTQTPARDMANAARDDGDEYVDEMSVRIATRRWDACYQSVNEVLSAVDVKRMQRAYRRIMEVRRELIEAKIPLPSSMKDAIGAVGRTLMEIVAMNAVISDAFSSSRLEDHVDYSRRSFAPGDDDE